MASTVQILACTNI
jgi:V-type H+-transporting ATPase proteolipid subunit